MPELFIFLFFLLIFGHLYSAACFNSNALLFGRQGKCAIRMASAQASILLPGSKTLAMAVSVARGVAATWLLHDRAS